MPDKPSGLLKLSCTLNCDVKPLMLLFAVSLANLSLGGLGIAGVSSASPFISNQKISITRSRFSRFLAPLVFSSVGSPVQLGASSFAQFQSSVVHLSSLTFRDTRFEGYRAHGNGATLSFRDPYLEASACLFQGNSAGSDGGAIWMDNEVGRLVVRQSFFLANAAGGRGGAISANAHSATITTTFFDGNTAPQGSHVFIESAAELEFDGSTFIRADSDTMAITVADTFAMRRCVFHNNTGPVNLTFTQATAGITIADSCFAVGTLFLSVTAPSGDASITLSNTCFESQRSDAVRANCRIAESNMTYGDCASCHYNPNTPAPTPTIHGAISDPALIAAVVMLCIVIVVAFAGSIRMGISCRRGMVDLRWSMSLSQSGYEEISASSTLQKPFALQT